LLSDHRNRRWEAQTFPTLPFIAHRDLLLTTGYSIFELSAHNSPLNFLAWASMLFRRIKPDLVAPGDSLISALSNGNGGSSCGTTTKTGTKLSILTSSTARVTINELSR
jgi:hypothetical protein